MKATYYAYLLLLLQGAIPATTFAQTSDSGNTTTQVSAEPKLDKYPNIRELDEPIRKLVLTIAATTLAHSADLSEQGLLGDPIIMSVTYCHVLDSVMTDETFATLPQHVQKYFRTLLLLEHGVVAEITHLEDTTPDNIIACNDKLNADKAALVPRYPKTAPVFNDLVSLMEAVTEQYNIIEVGNHYRDNDISMIYLAPDKITARVLQYVSVFLNDILVRESENANATVDPAEVLNSLKESTPSHPVLDQLDKNVYHFILTLAATGMDVASELAGEGLLDDPLVKAVTYGQVLRALLTDETMATLPSNYQAYFKKILSLEEETTSKLTQLNSEDPQLIQVIVEDRGEQQEQLIKEFPFASAVFNDMHVLITTVIQRFDLYNKAQAYRKAHLAHMDYSREQKRAIVLHHMSDILLEELAKAEKEQ